MIREFDKLEVHVKGFMHLINMLRDLHISVEFNRHCVPSFKSRTFNVSNHVGIVDDKLIAQIMPMHIWRDIQNNSDLCIVIEATADVVNANCRDIMQVDIENVDVKVYRRSTVPFVS